MNSATKTPHLTVEELETAFHELVIHFDKTVAQLEQATRLIAKQGQQYGEAIGWLKDIRKAAGATAPGISHQELCLLIKDLRRRALEHETRSIDGSVTTVKLTVPGKQPTAEEFCKAMTDYINQQEPH